MIPVNDLSVPDGALAGRVILISGAHGGLGEAAAKACAAAGATVLLLGRRVPKLNRLYDAIVASGAPTPAIIPLDLEGASPADYEQILQRIEDECGRLDGLLHCAASFKGLASIGNSAADDWVRGIHANLSAPVLLTQACLPLLLHAPDSAVVFSVNATTATQGAFWGAYGVAQSALRALIGTLSAEHEAGPLRVHGFEPGPMRTALRARAWFSENAGQWPLPSAYAQALVFLLTPDAAPHQGKVLAVRA